MSARSESLTQSRWAWLAREGGLVAGLCGLTVLGARIAVPLPWTPVPATLQVAAVVFAGAACGARRGVLSQLLYLLLGLAGLPVFANPEVAGPPVLALPTFGYLLAFPLAAYLASLWKGSRKRWLAGALSLLVIYAAGMLWLVPWALVAGQPVSAAWVLAAGFLPFFPFDILKAALAVWTAGPVRGRLADRP